MINREQDYINVALTKGELKVAYLKISSGDRRVIDVVKRDLREVPEEELPKILQSVLKELRVKRCRAIYTISSNVVTTKNIEIPSLDPDEIRSIIDLQAGRHTPYSREEILVGYITIGVFQRNYTKVLLIIANRDQIKQQLAVFDEAGLKVEKVLFAPEGIALFYAQALNIKPEDLPVGIIDVAGQSTDFVVQYNRTVATCRNIPIGMAQLVKEGQPAQDKLIEELLRSLEAYQNEDINKLPETFILSSDDAKIKELQPVLQEKLKANVKIMPYLDRIKASQPVMLKFVSEYSDDSFLDVIAMSSTMNELQVDLTPDELKVQRAIEEKGREMIKSAIYALVLLVLICGMFFSKLYFKDVYLEQLKDEYVKKRRAVAILDRVAQKTQIVKDYVNSRLESLDALEELYRLTPDDIYLNSVLLDENGTISIQGISESMSRVFNFVSDLEDSELFKSVKTKSTTAKKDRGKDVAAFEIAFKLTSAKDGPIGEEETAEEGDVPVPAADAP